MKRWQGKTQHRENKLSRYANTSSLAADSLTTVHADDELWWLQGAY
jgi:hypothetical protein